jgi:hypothetical protein
MVSPDPISADPDDAAVAERLRAFFSMASAQEGTVAPPATPAKVPAFSTPAVEPPPPPPPAPPTTPGLEDRPAPSGPPVFDPAEAEPAAPDMATVTDVAGLVRYLDAQLELTRRHTAQHLDHVLATVDARLAALDARLGEVDQARAADAALAETLVAFRNELFAWLEGYVTWEASRLAELEQRFPGGELPPPPPR